MDSVIGVNALRVGRTRSDGTPDYFNHTGGFVMCGGVSKLEFDFETESGSSIFARDAAGNACVNRRRPDDVKWTTFTLTLCRDDPRLAEILGGGTTDVLTDDAGTVVGKGIRPAAGCTGVSGREAVVLEVWSELQDCDQPSEPYPYRRTVFPLCTLTPKGFTMEDGLSLPVYEGYSQSNPNIGNGPFNDFFLTDDVGDYCYFDFGDDALPLCPLPIGYVPLPHS